MLSRRTALVTSAASVFIVTKPSLAAVMASPRKIFLANPHTGEAFHGIYWSDGSYIPEALHSIDVLMRDHITNEITQIDCALIDLLAGLRLKLGVAQPVQVTSGYRSPETNAAVRHHNSHAARHSYHMQGKAVDIRVPGFNPAKLRRAALELRAGGVGTYPDASFIHLDVGPVRVWTS